MYSIIHEGAREDISEGRFIEDEGLDRYMERWVNES